MWRIIKKIPFVESIISFVGQLGLTSYLQAGALAMLAAFWAVWGYLESHLPYWGIALLGLGAFAVMLTLFNQGMRAYERIKAERIDLQRLSAELIALGSEMMQAVNDYTRDRDRLVGGIVSIQATANPRAEWEKQIREGSYLVRHVSQKFGPRIMAAAVLLAKLEIKIPFHLSHLSEHSVMGLASYLGAVGHLIETGNLDAARAIDDNVGWAIHNLAR